MRDVLQFVPDCKVPHKAGVETCVWITDTQRRQKTEKGREMDKETEGERESEIKKS